MARSGYATGDFRSSVIQWISKVGQNSTTIISESAITLAAVARLPLSQGGNMPVNTGNLRNSLTPSKSEVAPTDLHLKGDRLELGDPTSQIQTVATSLKPGDHLYMGFRADYAAEQERKHAFVRLAAQRWPSIVQTVARMVSGSSR